MSFGGSIKITHHKIAHLFNMVNTPVKFFILPTLKSFNAILGNDSLKELKAIIHTEKISSWLTTKSLFQLKKRKYKLETIFNQD